MGNQSFHAHYSTQDYKVVSRLGRPINLSSSCLEHWTQNQSNLWVAYRTAWPYLAYLLTQTPYRAPLVSQVLRESSTTQSWGTSRTYNGLKMPSLKETSSYNRTSMRNKTKKQRRIWETHLSAIRHRSTSTHRTRMPGTGRVCSIAITCSSLRRVRSVWKLLSRSTQRIKS